MIYINFQEILVKICFCRFGNAPDVLLSKCGTLFGNISLIRDMKNAIDLCLKSGVEINKIVVRMQQNT